MPYIDRKQRERYDEHVFSLADQLIEPTGPVFPPVGDINYVLTNLLDTILFNLPHPPGYEDFNAIMGVLACVQQEFYRRVVVPFEDRAIERNGDVFNVS